MEKRITKKILLYFSLLLLFAIYVWLRVENSQFVHEPRMNFGDTNDYFRISKMSMFSSSFWLSIKPPVIPIFLKFLGENATAISTFQLWFSIACWGILSFVVASSLKVEILKILAFLAVLAFSLSEEIIMWDYLILSDSIALSLLALFLAACLWLLMKWSALRVSLLIVFAVLLAFCRDTYAYVLLMSAALLTLIYFLSSYRKRFLYMGLVFFVIFFFSSTLASISYHWYTPLLNTIGMRILPDQEYLAYFEKRGMPINPALMERSGKPHHAESGIMITDERLEEFRNWVRQTGRQEYIRFLWFYKADAFQNLFEDLEQVFFPDLYYYTATGFRPIIQNSRLDEFLYTNRFGFILFLAANLVAGVFSMVAYYEKKITWVLPIAMIIFTYPQAVLIWNADSSDIARHSLYHNVMMRLGVWILLFLVLDFFIEKLKKNKFSLFKSYV